MKRDLNITKDEFLKAKNYIFTIANITGNGITGWNFYLLGEDGTIKKVVGGSAWNEKKDIITRLVGVLIENWRFYFL
jgi:hypothetical protein